MEYQRVDRPESCSRIGTLDLGGHCLVCGFDVNPWAGKEVGLAPLCGGAEVILCGYGECFLAFWRAVPVQRLEWLGKKARHLSPFGDHGCRKLVDRGKQIGKEGTC